MKNAIGTTKSIFNIFLRGKIALEAADAVVGQLEGPRGMMAEVKGANLASTSADELQAKGRADEAQTTGDHEGVAFDAFIFAQVHFVAVAGLDARVRYRVIW